MRLAEQLPAVAICGGHPARVRGMVGSFIGRGAWPGWSVGIPNPGSVNTYWIERPADLVVVDTGRNITGVATVADQLLHAGKPAAIVVTHSHPDHVGGLGVLHERFPTAPIFASSATAE